MEAGVSGKLKSHCTERKGFAQKKQGNMNNGFGEVSFAAALFALRLKRITAFNTYFLKI